MQTISQRATLRQRPRRRPTQAGIFWLLYFAAVAVLVICS